MPDDLTPPAGTDEQEPVTPQVDEQPEVTDPEPQPEEPETPTGEPADEPETPAPAEPQTPSLDERYRASSSEAMILNAKNRGLESTLQKLTSEDTPTEPEILAEYPEFKTYNAVTQKLMRDTLENRKRQLRINRTLIEQEAERKWQADLRSIIRKPKYATLRDDPKFEEFVFQPKHTGVDIQTLADAYLVRTGKAAAPAAPVAPKPAPLASSGLPRGSGGPRQAARPRKLTIEEASVLRNSNYKEYMRQLRAGNIEEI